MWQKNKPARWICLCCWPPTSQITAFAASAKHPLSRAPGGGDRAVFLSNWQTYGALTSHSFFQRGPVSLSAAGVLEELALIARVIHSPEGAIIFFICLERSPQDFLFPLPLLFLHLLQLIFYHLWIRRCHVFHPLLDLIPLAFEEERTNRLRGQQSIIWNVILTSRAE